MPEPLPVVLVPGLNCSARLYAEQIPALWRFGPVQVADHTRDDSIEAIAARILAHAPRRFALAGLSMGGYIALTMVRQASARVTRLALLDTSARPETPEQSERRQPQISLAQGGCPTLVLVGDGDQLTPPPLSEEIAAGIAGSRLVVVADCGHLSTMERPEAVNSALLEWMAR
jgi:pimeloyl-ACP methyl ester carboxylesterase